MGKVAQEAKIPADTTSHAYGVVFRCVAIFFIALLFRVALIIVTKSYLAPERTEVVNVARSLAAHGEFANAYSPTSGPTAHTSPIYPLLLSVVYRWFGTGQAGEVVQEVFACCLASLLWGWMPAASSIFGLGTGVGVVAGLMGALLPINRWPETKGSFEAPLTAVMSVMLFSAFLYAWRPSQSLLARAVGLGILGALAILVAPTLASAVVVLLLLSCFRFRRDEAIRIGTYVLVVAAVAFSLLLPWGIRNYRVMGKFIVTRSNFGLELQASNNDFAKAKVYDNAFANKRYHPKENRAELQRVESMGEIAYNRQKLQEATDWIRAHPRRFMSLTVQRVFYFWFPNMKRPAQTVLLGLLTLGAILGGFRLYRDDHLVAIAFVSVLLTYPLIYYIVQSDARYVYPISWMIYFLAAYYLFGMWSSVRNSRTGTTQ